MKTEYFGSTLSPKENEIRSLRIDPFHRECEASLIASRWFDYSQLHPTQATYLYAHIYKRQTRVFCETYVDARTVDESRAFANSDVFQSTDKAGMWLARGAADSLGIKYDFVMWFAQERAINRTYKSFPRPNQLYGEEFEMDLEIAWKESLARSMCYSREERYLAKNYKGSVWQKRHVRFVIDQIKARPAPHVNLLARMISQGILNTDMLENDFSFEVIEAVQAAVIRLHSQS